MGESIYVSDHDNLLGLCCGVQEGAVERLFDLC